MGYKSEISFKSSLTFDMPIFFPWKNTGVIYAIFWDFFFYIIEQLSSASIVFKPVAHYHSSTLHRYALQKNWTTEEKGVCDRLQKTLNWNRITDWQRCQNCTISIQTKIIDLRISQAPMKICYSIGFF